MASISEDIEIIRNGVYGEDVREAIADGLSRVSKSIDLPDATDLNTVKTTGVYRLLTSRSFLNMPMIAGDNTYGTPVLIVYGLSDTQVKQIITYVTTSVSKIVASHTRCLNGTTWTNWISDDGSLAVLG